MTAADGTPAGPSRLDRLRSHPALLTFAAIALAGIGLRLWLAVAYQPSIVNLDDVLRWTLMARHNIFAEPGHPGGYPLLLRLVHDFGSTDLDRTIALQHLLGLATAALVYGIVARTAARWAAVAAAAAVLLSVDQIYLEHALMPETLFGFGLALTGYLAVRALDDGRPLMGPVTTRHAWIAGSGAALGLTTTVRIVGEVMIPLLALWFAFALATSLRGRAAAAALALVAAAVPPLTYSAFNEHHRDNFGLLVPGSGGWGLYARVAQFADCDEFDPPAQTVELCETTPTGERPGPDFYYWADSSPARELFDHPPQGGDELWDFSTQAILHQPTDYLGTVLHDLRRYFVPDNDREGGGHTYADLAVDRREPALEQSLQREIDVYWTPERLDIDDGAVESLARVQGVLRLHPGLMLLAVVLAGAGIVLARGRARATLALLLGGSIAALLVPAAVTTYAARYSVPTTGLLAAAAMIGLWCALEHWRRRPS